MDSKLCDVGRDGKPDWSRYNASVLGNTPFDNGIYSLSHLPGINHEPFFYVNVFFGATREYGPEEGWQTVQRRRKGRRAVQATPIAHTSFPYAAIDSQK